MRLHQLPGSGHRQIRRNGSYVLDGKIVGTRLDVPVCYFDPIDNGKQGAAVLRRSSPRHGIEFLP